MAELASKLPTLAVRGVQPDYRPVYKFMRAEWRRRTQQNYDDLANHWKTSKQLVTQWATGSGGASQPPMWAMQWLCWQLGLVMVVAPDGVRVVKDLKTDPGDTSVVVAESIPDNAREDDSE